ncbi:MAG: GWxTD domain-containing protein [Acidobacteriota bacterium]|nr:GWxTD domain-containing protein [Acidobacteriota bacterium]
MTVKRILRAASVLALAAFAGGGGPSPKKETPKPPREADLIAALPEDDRLWLTEFAAPILREEERKAYLELTETYQRDDFREKFWQRRELPELTPPLGPGYRHRYRELKEIVDSRYGGWRSDAGKVVLRFGEPSDVLKPNCQGDDVFRELEVWTYTNLGASGRGQRRYIFFRPYVASPLQMWTVLDGDAKVFLPSSCRTGFFDLRKDCSTSPPEGRDKCFPCEDRCSVYRAWEEIRARQGNGSGALIEQASLVEPQPVSTEGLVRDRDKWVTAPKAGAKKIDVQGPGGSGSVAAATPTPSPTAGPLSPEDLARAIAALDVRYREFLDLAKPLMSESEVVAFVRMTNGKRDEFRRTFWTREKGDDPNPRKNGPPPPRTPGMGFNARTPAPI